jgi:hypothetical protein
MWVAVLEQMARLADDAKKIHQRLPQQMAQLPIMAA